MNNSTTNSTSAPFDNTFSIAYASVGGCGILVNAYIFAVFIININLLKRSPLIFGVTCSHILCAVAIGTIGAYRLANTSYLSTPTSAWSCAMLIIPVLYPFAFQSMGIILILVGIERFQVFSRPAWFRDNWTHGFAWRLVAGAYASVAVSMSAGLYAAWYQPSVTWMCSHQSVFSGNYILYSGIISVIGGTAAVALTVTSLVMGTKHIKKLPLASGESGRYKKQLKLTRSMLCVSFLDFCFVVIPNTLITLSLVGVKFPVSSMSQYTNVVYCVNSVLIIVPYVMFNSQFRQAALACLRGNHKVHGSTKAALTLNHGRSVMGESQGKMTRVKSVKGVTVC